MRVALFVTCLVDAMRPAIGFAALRLLESAGCSVSVPEEQTCCGQPAWSAGEAAIARELALKNITDLEGYDYVVLPSASCADHIKNVYPGLVAELPEWAAKAADLAARTYELTSFLVDVLRMEEVPGAYTGTVTYHDSCKGLRQLGIKEQPRKLLAKVPGLRLREMEGCEECCGFGGAFAARFGEVSTVIVDRKCAAIAATGADAVVGGDLGCLLNMEGRLRRRGDQSTQVLHIAQLLAGEGV